MKKYFNQYKPFLRFLAVFFAVYLGLSFVYRMYLKTFEGLKYPIDSFSQLVAEQTKDLIIFFGKPSFTYLAESRPWVYIGYQDRWLAEVVEGCNAVSVMILFVSFVIAFAGKPLKTFLFCLAGVVVIHVLNVARIAILLPALYYYPEHKHLVHGVIFPLIIYGVVFCLWVLWVLKFSNLVKKQNE